MESVWKNKFIRGLLQWYPFIPGKKAVLIAGDESGPLSASHSTREVFCAFLTGLGLKVDIASYQSIPEAGYDYVICDRVLERAEAPGEVLGKISRLLEDDGILLLYMNNRFGIRYFCGDRDPYTWTIFDGIENYIGSKFYHGDLFS